MANYGNAEVEDFLADEHFLDWIIRPTPANEAYWQEWIRNHPEQIEKLNEAIGLVQSINVKPIGSLKPEEIDQMVEQLKERCPEENSRYIFSWFLYGNPLLRVAAVVFLLMITGLIYFKSNPHDRKPTVSIMNPFSTPAEAWEKKINGTTYPILVLLSDKTSIVLHPGGELKYPRLFQADKREVYLSGEALFEVSKDAMRPFLVHSGDMTTKVLGTSFSIKAEKDAQAYEVIVNTGKVSVASKKAGKDKSAGKEPEVLLKPNDKLVFERKTEKLVKTHMAQPVKLSHEVSAKSFNFHEAPFSDIINKIGDAYAVKIVYNEEDMGNCPLTATLTDQSLDEKLNLICNAMEASYVVTNGKIVINGKGCNNIYSTKYK